MTQLKIAGAYVVVSFAIGLGYAVHKLREGTYSDEWEKMEKPVDFIACTFATTVLWPIFFFSFCIYKLDRAGKRTPDDDAGDITQVAKEIPPP